jgi:anti-sigma B factor antagonist
VLKIRAQTLGDVVILRVQGQIVMGGTEALRRALFSEPNASALVLDLARVSRIDAHGLGLLLEARKHCEAQGIEFRIMNVSKLVEQVLEITRLNTVFEVTSEKDVVNLRTRRKSKKVVERSQSKVVEA